MVDGKVSCIINQCKRAEDHNEFDDVFHWCQSFLLGKALTVIDIWSCIHNQCFNRVIQSPWISPIENNVSILKHWLYTQLKSVWPNKYVHSYTLKSFFNWYRAGRENTLYNVTVTCISWYNAKIPWQIENVTSNV